VNRAFARFPKAPLTKEEALFKVKSEMSNPIKWARYQAINVLPANTVEFRFFQSTLDLSLLNCYIDLIYQLVTQAPKISWESCATWEAWFKTAPESLLAAINKLI
jgi:hypothetical protein